MMTTKKKSRANPDYVRTTETAPLNGDPPEKYRRAWGNTSECTHRWASNALPDGRSGNVFFRGGTIYSYGNHFPMARWVKVKGGEVVIFLTTRTYSPSTSGHLSGVRHAIPRDVKVFHVQDVDADLRHQHVRNLNVIRDEVAEWYRKSVRATANKVAYLDRAASRIKEGNEYAEAVGLKQRLGPPEGGDLAEWVAGIVAEKAREKAAETRKEKAALERHRAETAVKVAEWDQKLTAWKDGGEHPGNWPGEQSEPVGLRIKGRCLETSMRAVVPLKAALPVLKAIREGKPLPEGFEIDGFRLREIDAEERTVTIGCHLVSFDEIERLAKKHNL